MVRVVFTVALAVAVLAVSLPAIERGGVHRSDAAVRSAVDRLVSEARALSADSDALPADLSGARRSLELDLPEEGTASAGLAELRIASLSVTETRSGTGTGTGTRITWRVRGGTSHTVHADGLALRPANRSRDALVFETGGRRRLVLELVRIGGRRVIRIRVGDGSTAEGSSRSGRRSRPVPCSTRCRG